MNGEELWGKLFFSRGQNPEGKGTEHRKLSLFEQHSKNIVPFGQTIGVFVLENWDVARKTQQKQHKWYRTWAPKNTCPCIEAIYRWAVDKHESLTFEQIREWKPRLFPPRKRGRKGGLLCIMWTWISNALCVPLFAHQAPGIGDGGTTLQNHFSLE